MAIAIMSASPPANGQPKKPQTVLKKVLKYFQDQALEQSTSKTYLTPPGQEPQQRIRQRPRPQQKTQGLSRTFSDATTAVETRQQGSGRAQTGGHRSSFAPGYRAPPAMTQNINKIQYGHDNWLQSYEIYVPENPTSEDGSDKYWVLFVHGGYFRDPKVDAASIRPALELLAASSPTIAEESDSNSLGSDRESNVFSAQHQVAGYASINYRLSPHPAYPQDPSTTPNYELRTARWPDQLNDIHAAIKHLQSKHSFGSNYILAGHSVGATLAYLAALKAKDMQVQPPKCVIGLNGIYDFPAIHISNPDYESMTRNAINPAQYREASPAVYPAREYADLSQHDVKHFIVSHSRDDGLVIWDQAVRMHNLLEDAKTVGGAGLEVKLLETKGQHDEIWKQGTELARMIREGLSMLTAR